MRTISSGRGLLATLMPCALALACSDPELASELDPDGPPEIVEVAVSNESANFDPNGNNLESATYCRDGDEYKVSTFYCPLRRDDTNTPIPGRREFETIEDATPMGWYTGFVFTELLDGDIEDVDGLADGTALAASDPFILTCGGVEQEYTGWYDSSGNHLSYPAGPRLVAQIANFVATGSECEVALREGVVVDKDGDAVPSDQLGPYQFKIAAMSVSESSPENEAEGVALDTVIEVSFNAPVDFEGTIDGTDRITVNIDPEFGEDEDGNRVPIAGTGTPIAGTLSVKSEEEDGEVTVSPEIMVFTPATVLEQETTYSVDVTDGVEDIAGGALAQGDAPFVAAFTTGTGEE